MLKSFYHARLHDLGTAWSLMQGALETKQLPPPKEVPSSVIATLISFLLMINILLSPRGRKIVVETLDTVVATILIVLIVCIVLGFPVGKVPPNNRRLHIQLCCCSFIPAVFMSSQTFGY